MLVAPLSLSAASVSRRHTAVHPLRHARHAEPRPPRASWAQAWVALWFAAGLCALVTIPAARGSTSFGATLPFWLVVAPLIDLLWLKRTLIGNSLRRRPKSNRLGARVAVVRQTRT